MAWSCDRRATADEVEAVREAAEQFCKRHGIDPDGGAVIAVECEVNPAPDAPQHAAARGRRLRKLWRAILKRVTGSPDGIAYGYVGRPAD